MVVSIFGVPNMTIPDHPELPHDPVRDRALRLCTYLKGLAEQRQKKIRRVDEYESVLWFWIINK